MYEDEGVHSAPVVEAYMTAIPQEKQRIHSIRDSFDTPVALPEETYRSAEAHMTVMPKFKVPQEHVHKLTTLANSLDIPTKAEVTGAGVYPSIDVPRVVLLDAIAEFESVRNRLKRFIQDHNCKTHSDPVRPHITMLLATNDTEARQIPEFSKEHIQDKVGEHRTCWETRFDSIRLELSVPE